MMKFGQIFIFLFCNSLVSEYVSQTTVYQNGLFETIYGSKGVMVFLDTDKNCSRDIVIYELNGTVFSSISLKHHSINFKDYKASLSGSEFSKASLDRKYHFNPQQFYPDYGVVIFAYKAIRAGKAEVYIDKENKMTKFIKIDPTLFSVENWKAHLTGAVTSIDNLNNPLKSKPDNLIPKSQSIVPDDASFQIIGFSGQWVQVECFSFCESMCEKKYRGWVRWTDGKQPLLKLYYAC